MGCRMRIQPALAPAVLSSKPVDLRPVLKLAPGSQDSFEPARKPKLDASAKAAMAKLDRISGKISGEQLRTAILSGIKDRDGHGATSELATIEAWAARNGAKLDPKAKAVLADYVKIARAARSSGSTGLNDTQVAQLKSQTAASAGSKLHSGNDDLKSVLANPNLAFKRQGYSARFNPRPDELHNGKVVRSYSNGNCGPTSLAMAVKAFGLEESRVRGNQEDSIDLARNAMTLKPDPAHPKAWDTLTEPKTNDMGTYEYEMIRGAKRLGLTVNKMPIDNRNPLKALDAAFAKGRMVLLSGQPGQPGSGFTAYEQAMRQRSADTVYQYDKGHSILVMGKDSAGRYLVADPLSRNGVVHMTAKELSSFEQWHGEEVSG